MKTFLVRAGGYGGGIGDVVYTEKADGTGREYFLYNATGTTSALTDDDGVVTSTSCYTAWGIETATQGETENIRKFSTKERSELLGIDYFGFRYYDPDLGRFFTRDPSGYPDGPNNYLYCTNSPVNNIDPLGLKSEETSVEEVKKEAQEEKKRLPGWGEMFKKTFGGMFDFKKNIKQSCQEAIDLGQNTVQAAKTLSGYDYYKETWNTRVETGVAQGESELSAGIAASLLIPARISGLAQINEAFRGIDLTTGQQLQTADRTVRGAEGVISLALLGKGVAGKGGSTAQTQVQGD